MVTGSLSLKEVFYPRESNTSRSDELEGDKTPQKHTSVLVSSVAR